MNSNNLVSVSEERYSVTNNPVNKDIGIESVTRTEQQLHHSGEVVDISTDEGTSCNRAKDADCGLHEAETIAEEATKKVNTCRTPVGQSIQLHASENAWKPMYKTQQGVAEKEKLRRSVQSVLNKLTFQKFKILLAQLKKLHIDCEEEMKLVVDLIYENAIYEPYFCVLYANLCKHLATKTPFANQPDGHADFHTLLLATCQNGFDEKFNEFIQDALPCQQIEMKKLKTRWIGNIRFMGELYKFNMIQTIVILDCIKTLLKLADEDSLECFCWLMKTAGKELEISKDFEEKLPMDEYFAQIQKIVDNRLTCSRIRFMLQDIIELRKNDWVPRRVENIPRTIDEIRKEAAYEAQKQFKMYHKMVSNVEIPDDSQVNSTCHNSCLCGAERSKPENTKINLSALSISESKLETPNEVKSLLFARGRKGKKNSFKSNSKKNSSHAQPENKTESQDSCSSKSEL
ncbi:eukaryotic translation initiation factor 4 gamma 3 [Nephila pilipes]|uniref:Eukaryotic translation initiation factor 4 gamma 3 n=1 Tax=Nephila pilipes TaxID=299642 RepID=A0A8X6UAH1_NEPPI|nr:eukaryotic translation initiation factor 4 gamma 3 [Nephila pilipes]